VPGAGLICAICGHTFDHHDLSAKAESVQRVYKRDHIQCLFDDVTMKVGCSCTGFEPGRDVAQKRPDLGDFDPRSMCASCMHPWSVHEWRGSRYGDWKRGQPGCRFEFAKTESFYPAASKTCDWSRPAGGRRRLAAASCLRNVGNPQADLLSFGSFRERRGRRQRWNRRTDKGVRSEE